MAAARARPVAPASGRTPARPARRRWLAALLVGATALPAARAAPRFTVSLAQLQQAVGQRFPLRYPIVGLLALDLQAPRLRLLPADGRIAAEIDVIASGPALYAPRSGRFDVDFEPRYEAADRTLRAHRLRVRGLRIDGLSAQGTALLERHGPALAEQVLQDAVLHQLDAAELAPLDALGLQPGALTVTETGLSIGLVPKPL